MLASTEPVEPRLLAQLVELPVTRVEALCDELAREYEESGRGFVLAQVAGGYRFQTHPDLAAYVERFVLDGQHARLSGPALETLAIVAYKQPISRGQMSAIRGVNVEATLTTLLQRGYVQEVGRDPGPGARGALRHHAASSSSGSASPRSTTSRRSATSCPTRRWSRRSSGGCASATTRGPTSRPTPTPTAGADADPRVRLTRSWPSDPTASGCRRSSRAPASGSRRVCEELIADGRVTVNGEVARARPPGRRRARRASRSTASPSSCATTSSTTC